MATLPGPLTQLQITALSLFLPCGCAISQSCECPLYERGCGECFDCTVNADVLAHTGTKGTLPCACATGLRRLRVPLQHAASPDAPAPFIECTYPRTLLEDAQVMQPCLQESVKQLLWSRLVLSHLTRTLRDETTTADAYMARIQREMMLTEDSAAYCVYADRVGAYVDSALFFKRSKRERTDVLFRSCQEELLRTHTHLITLNHTTQGVRTLWRKLAGFHISRWIRGCHARAVMRRRLTEVLRDAAARFIQAVWRGWYTRVRVFAPMRAARRHLGALTFQRVWRSWRVRKPYLARKRVRRAYQRMLLACRVQAAWRGKMARKRYATLRGSITVAAHPRVQALLAAAQQLQEADNDAKQAKAGRAARATFSILTMPLESLTARLSRDVYKLGEAVSRQVTPYVAARSKVNGRGKWSRPGDVGTLGMLRRFAGREADLTNVYSIGLDVEYGVRLPLALAAKRRNVGLHDAEIAAALAEAAHTDTRPSSPFARPAGERGGRGGLSPLARHPRLSPFPPHDELLASIDEPVLQHERVRGMPREEFLTHAELCDVAARKAAWPGMTASLEEAVAQRCAASLVSAVIDVVTSYLQHLQVSQRRAERDLAIATNHARRGLGGDAEGVRPVNDGVGMHADGKE